MVFQARKRNQQAKNKSMSTSNSKVNIIKNELLRQPPPIDILKKINLSNRLMTRQQPRKTHRELGNVSATFQLNELK